MAKTTDYDLGEFTFPRGWFMIGDAEELGDRPIAVRYFGQDFALYRGESGRVVLLDAYCPHMGTHLASNTTAHAVRGQKRIEGDSIRCPLHGWRFGPDGRCDDIPYSPAAIAQAACIQSWPVIERAGGIWMWHDEEGGEPDYELPPFAEWDQPGWVRWKLDHMGELAVHPQEILDNMADRGHMTPVHGTIGCEHFENIFDDHVVVQRFRAGHRSLDDPDARLELVTWYTGPGILQSRKEGAASSIILITHTPVDDGVVKVWHGLLVKVANDVPNAEDVALARMYQEQDRLAFAQDFEIWMHKRACVHPLQVAGDGPFGKLRIWYKQFYNPRPLMPELQKRVNGSHVTRGTNTAPWEA